MSAWPVLAALEPPSPSLLLAVLPCLTRPPLLLAVFMAGLLLLLTWPLLLLVVLPCLTWPPG